MYLDIPSPEIYLIAFLLGILTDAPLTVRHIFEDNHNWDAFRLAEKDNRRDVEKNEVNKMLSCKDKSRGFHIPVQTLRNQLNSPLWMQQSHLLELWQKNHRDKWAISLQNALWGVPHRHVVLTIPDALWPVVRNNRFLLKVLIEQTPLPERSRYNGERDTGRAGSEMRRLQRRGGE